MAVFNFYLNFKYKKLKLYLILHLHRIVLNFRAKHSIANYMTQI